MPPLPCRAMARTCRCSVISISFNALSCLHASESRVFIVAWYRLRSSRARASALQACAYVIPRSPYLIVAVPDSLPWPDYGAWLANNPQLRVLVRTACTVGSQQPHSLLMRRTVPRRSDSWIAQSFRHMPTPNCAMTQIRTSSTRRTWAEKLMLWKQAFRTKILDQDRKAVGRGPTPEAAQEAAERVWVAEGQRAYEANRDPSDAL